MAVKRGMPTIQWTRQQLEAWWAKNGIVREDEKETNIWDSKKCEYKTKLGKVIDDLDQVQDDIGNFLGDNGGALANCCGISEIGEFSADWPSKGWTAEQKAAFASWCIRNSTSVQGNFLCTTIQKQKEVAEVLALIGFEPLKTVTSFTTGNKITVWMATIGKPSKS